jgi:hypothetical protein
MSDVSLHQSAGVTSGISTEFAGQTRIHLRALQRDLCHHGRPTNLQRALLRTAAVAQAKLDAAVRDPAITGTALGHIERVARRATAAAYAAFPKPPAPPEPTLEELLGHE